MSFARQCEKLESYSELVNDEFKHAIRFIKDTPNMTADENEMIAKSFAAGIAQLALLRAPLILAALELEMPASKV